MAMLALVGLAATACSEAEPEATTSTADPGAETDCASDLLGCARASTLGELVPAEPTKATGEPIELGMINQENTAAGSFPELSGADQAGIAFINEQLGGVDGRPIELEVCNTKFSPEGSTACAQQFSEAGVPAVLGGIDVFGNAVDTLEANGIPYVGGIPVSAERAEVVVDDVLDDCVVGIEVAVSEVAAHAGDLLPGHVGYFVREVGIDALDRLADLDQTDADRVVDQSIVEIASGQVIPDGVDGIDDVV